jgi:hypothetical protein
MDRAMLLLGVPAGHDNGGEGCLMLNAAEISDPKWPHFGTYVRTIFYSA